MYQVKIVVKPNVGISEVLLEADRKDRNSISSLAFYAKISKEIEIFEKRVKKIATKGGAGK